MAALAAWRRVAPEGRLLLAETAWGRADPASRLRRRARAGLRRLRGGAPSHHAPYPAELRQAASFPDGITPEEVCQLVEAAGWPSPGLSRAPAVEWARRLSKSLPERLLGVDPVYLVVSGP